MRLVIIKVILFIGVMLVALFDYRMISVKDGKLLVANWHQVSSWSEIESSVLDIDKAEVYSSRISRRSNDEDSEHYLVIYMDRHFYNVKANDLEMDRISQLMKREQVEIVEVEPVDAWFYGLLVVVLVIFPVMRKEESQYDKK